MTERQITGKQVFLVTASAFAVIIAVNFTMAFKAVSTFPGLEVKNSYVASQSFEARRDAQDALGWTVSLDYENGTLSLDFLDRDGQPVRAEDVSVLIGRKTSAAEDQTPDFTLANNTFTAPITLNPGFWTIRLTARAEDGTAFQQRLSLRVPG